MPVALPACAAAGWLLLAVDRTEGELAVLEWVAADGAIHEVPVPLAWFPFPVHEGQAVALAACPAGRSPPGPRLGRGPPGERARAAVNPAIIHGPERVSREGPG